MGFFRNWRLRMQYYKRLGAFVEFSKQGLSPDEARVMVDHLVPPTPELLEYELRQSNSSKRRSS
jgi:hypothetical protein